MSASLNIVLVWQFLMCFSVLETFKVFVDTQDILRQDTILDDLPSRGNMSDKVIGIDGVTHKVIIGLLLQTKLHMLANIPKQIHKIIDENVKSSNLNNFEGIH
jgi:hypothetical protein